MGLLKQRRIITGNIILLFVAVHDGCVHLGHGSGSSGVAITNSLQIAFLGGNVLELFGLREPRNENGGQL